LAPLHEVLEHLLKSITANKSLQTQKTCWNWWSGPDLNH